MIRVKVGARIGVGDFVCIREDGLAYPCRPDLSRVLLPMQAAEDLKPGDLAFVSENGKLHLLNEGIASQ